MIKKIKGSKRLKESTGNEFGYLEYTQYVPKDVLQKLEFVRKNAIELANLINSHDYILTYTDAKLHDVFYEFDDVDDLFLDVKWQDFEEYVKEKDCEIDDVRSSSSKFYVTNDFMDEIHDLTTSNRRGDIDPITPEDIIFAIAEAYFADAYLLSDVSMLLSDEKLNEYIHDTLMDGYDVSLNDLAELVPEFVDDDEDYNFDILFDISSGEFNAAKKSIENVIDCYNYIIDFKKNQVQIYQDFLDANSEFEESYSRRNTRKQKKISESLNRYLKEPGYIFDIATFFNNLGYNVDNDEVYNYICAVDDTAQYDDELLTGDMDIYTWLKRWYKATKENYPEDIEWLESTKG